MRFKTGNPDIILEDTGYVTVHNYPPTSSKTMSYITRLYRVYQKDKFGWQEMNGEPIYFLDLPKEQLAMAIILGTAQNALAQVLPHSKELTLIKDNENI